MTPLVRWRHAERRPHPLDVAPTLMFTDDEPKLLFAIVSANPGLRQRSTAPSGQCAPRSAVLPALTHGPDGDLHPVSAVRGREANDADRAVLGNPFRRIHLLVPGRVGGNFPIVRLSIRQTGKAGPCDLEFGNCTTVSLHHSIVTPQYRYTTVSLPLTKLPHVRAGQGFGPGRDPCHQSTPTDPASGTFGVQPSAGPVESTGTNVGAAGTALPKRRLRGSCRVSIALRAVRPRSTVRHAF